MKRKTIPLEELGRCTVVTIYQLKDFVSKNYRQASYGYDGSEYFDGLEHIYLVEKNEEEATITEVRLDIDIE